jgi:hypothetical protein
MYVYIYINRVFAMLTTSIVTVYLVMAGVIVALGVMNTAMASACSRLADADQVRYMYMYIYTCKYIYIYNIYMYI